MKSEEEESTPRSSSGANKGKRKPKQTSHNHIGPNVRALRVGRAFCPICDAEKVLRLTEEEREAEKTARAKKASR